MHRKLSFRPSLKVKVATAATFLFLVVVVLIASIQMRLIREDLTRDVETRQSRLAARAAFDLDQKVATNLLALTREALVIPPAVMARPREMRTYLEQRPTILLLFDAVLVFSTSGEILADAPELSGRQGLQAGDREYFVRSIATGRPVISAPYLSRASQRPMIVMTAPIRDEEGRLLGFLGGSLELMKPNFLGALSTTTIGNSGYFFLITKDRPSVYAVHPDPSMILKPSVGAGGASANARALAGAEETITGVDGGGVPTLFSYRSLSAVNWLVGTSYPLAEALAPVSGTLARLWWITSILGLLLAPGVWWLASHLLAPLMRLHDDIRRLLASPGQVSPTLLKRHDEIGVLARDFNALIAERQQSIEALRRSSQLLDNIVENIPVSIQLKDVNDDFRFVMWNKAAERVYGLPRERVLGRTVQETWSPEEVIRYREADLLAVASNGQEFKHRLATTAFGTIASHMRKVPLLDANGVATHLLVLTEDISERVAAEARLSDSEARFRGAAESALDAFFVLDSVRDAAGEILDFRFRYLNANGERLIAQPDGQALGRLLCELYPAQRRDGHFDKYCKVVATGTPLDEEYRAADAGDGTATWLHHQVVRIDDGIAVTTRDISARKAAEEALRTSRAFLQSLIDNLPVAVYVKDVRTATFGKMVVWNRAAGQISGVAEADALGRTDQEIFTPEVYREIEVTDREMLAQPRIYDFPEHPLRRADGTLAFIHTISVPLFDGAGAQQFILRISEDVTAARRQKKELRARTAELLILSDASPHGLFRTDARGQWTYVNRSYEVVAGASSSDSLGDGWTRAIHPDDRERVTREWHAAVANDAPSIGAHRYLHADGRVTWASVRAARVMVDGNCLGYVGSVDDITTRREVEEALLQNEHRLRTITDTMPAWIAYVDRNEIYRFVNAAFETGFGENRERVVGRSVRQFVGEAAYATLKPHLEHAFSGHRVTFERECTGPDGTRWIETTYIPEITPGTGVVVGLHAMLQDVTEQKLQEQRLLRLSQVDSLTGLANRVGFEQRLRDSMAESVATRSPLAVMYIDIDRFKSINDTHGHATGDALLVTVAQRLQGSLRKSDMVARLGGDEFVAVLERLPDTAAALRLAAHALEAVQQPFAFGELGNEICVTASIGIAYFAGDATTPDQLVAEADAMLYAAKQRGRNNVFAAAALSEPRARELAVH